MRKKAIMSISFGTNDPGTAKRNIDRLEADYKAAYPGCPLYRVITNEAVIELMQDEGDPVYAVREAMARMVLDGVTHLYAQPSYLLNGREYDELETMIYTHRADFIDVKVGQPLLHSHRDIERTAQALMESEFADLSAEEAAVFVAHGSPHTSNATYCALDYVFKDLGYENAHVATFNAYPQIDTVIRHLKKAGTRRVHVAPFMFVAGQSAMEGVCGDAANSMKSQLTAAGFEVVPHRKCLGEYDGVRGIYLDHLAECLG